MTSSSRLSRSTISFGVVAAVLATAFLGISASPAQAAGIGSGRAVVHVDAPEATVTKQADGTYLLAMPKGTTGQWMGTRTNAAGKKKVRVGNLTGEMLAANWSNLRYTSAGTVGTLVWDAAAKEPGNAPVRISQPTSSSSGVTFTIASQAELPSTLTNVILSLDRAPAKKGLRASMTQTAPVSGNLSVSAISQSASSAQGRIYDSSSNGTCWQSNTFTSKGTGSAGAGNCAGIAYGDYITNSSTPYGAMFQIGSLFFNLNITPPGQAAYHYTKTFYF